MKGDLAKAERLELAILKARQYSLRRIAGVMERGEMGQVPLTY
jgi:hypothetical protein